MAASWLRGRASGRGSRCAPLRRTGPAASWAGCRHGARRRSRTAGSAPRRDGRSLRAATVSTRPESGGLGDGLRSRGRRRRPSQTAGEPSFRGETHAATNEGTRGRSGHGRSGAAGGKCRRAAAPAAGRARCRPGPGAPASGKASTRTPIPLGRSPRRAHLCRASSDPAHPDRSRVVEVDRGCAQHHPHRSAPGRRHPRHRSRSQEEGCRQHELRAHRCSFHATSTSVDEERARRR